MGFREDWEAWHVQNQAQRAAAFQLVLGQARERWQGRRVWVWGVDSEANFPPGVFPLVPRQWVYGEVEAIGDDGCVQVLRGYTSRGHPLYWWGKLEHLGHLVVLAEE